MATSGSLVWGEAQVVRLLLEGRHHDAVQAVLDWLGPEVRELLLSTLQDREAADDAHARFQFAVHARLDRWSRTGSLRFWALGLARDAARETPPRRTLAYRTESLRTAARPPASPAPIDGGPVTEDLSGLRSLLSPDDALLLWLRVGQAFTWAEVAAAFSGRGIPVAEAQLRRRFEKLKELLHRERALLGLTGDGEE
jgi:DNA-directed RNA polymerase specialized sigma24 family protein